MTHGFEREALAEYREAAEYYAAQRGGLGEAFVAAVKASLEEIDRCPARYQPVGDGLRVCRMKRFPYSIYFRYSEERDHATVFAVMHTRRSGSTAWASSLRHSPRPETSTSSAPPFSARPHQ